MRLRSSQWPHWETVGLSASLCCNRVTIH